jgi:hypothetical protein
MRYLLGSLAVYDFDVRGSVHDFRAAIKKNESMQSVVIDSMYSGRIVLRLDVADFKDDRIDPEHIDLLIATLRIDPVFPSRIRSYENQPLVHFSLPKNSPNKYKVKITIPDIMETFSETTVEQKNTENGLCSVQLLLNDTRVLGNTSNRKVYAEIELCDVSNRKMICQPIAAPVTIYEKNAMDWKVPGTIATFVTFRDQAVIDIASKSIKGLSDSHLKGITKNLLKGSAVFTAVKESGISYVKDPIALPGTVMLDRVQFPLETVKRAAGDCDDLSVLYASLLSSVGIPCAMVIFPGHVFVMFDTGIFEKNRYRLSLDTSLTITHNGTLWVPVETTAPGSGFKNAWFNAAQEFSNALSAGEHIQIIDLADAWETWPPPQFPGTFHTPELKNLNSAVISEIKVLQKATDSINGASIKYAMASMEKNDSSQIALDYNKIGVFEVRQGDYSKAQTWFEKSLALHKNHSVAANLAGALFLQGNELNSLQLFDSLVRYDTDGTIALNQALCLYAQKLQPGQVDQVIKSFKNAVSKMSDTHSLERYLGFSLTISEGRKGNYQSLPENNTVNVSQLSALIRSSILDGERLNVSGTTSETSSGTKFSGTTSETSSGSLAVDKKQIVMPSGRVKGADPEMCVGLKDLLYWFE